MNMKNVLLKHYKMYPKIQIQDVVKLIYQNEFGGGHLISDEADSLKRLQVEMEMCSSALTRVSQGSQFPITDMFEEIGNELCRLHLKALKHTGIDITTINRFFVCTANSVCGRLGSFEKKLDILLQCCRDGELTFSPDELHAYLLDYKELGYSPVSHSEKYRTAYSPSYRIVKCEYRDFFEIFRRIDCLLKKSTKVIVAIDGNSGSGKSTLASLIGGIYDCNIFHMDHYFLRPELKTKKRLKEIGGNVDYVRFKDEIITGLQSVHKFTYRIYDCKKQSLGAPVTVTPKKLNIIEGSYSMHPTLTEHYDLKIFLHTDEESQKLRIRERNGDSMLQRFLDEWIPMENQYFKKMKIREKCALVFRR
jgi:uridine kinase